MFSAKWKVSWCGLALILSTLAAHGQQAPSPAGAIATTTERTTFFTRGCALRDLQLVTLMEDLADTKEATGDKLFQAFLTMMRARTTCIAGRESEALSIYDTIALNLAPTRAAR